MKRRGDPYARSAQLYDKLHDGFKDYAAESARLIRSLRKVHPAARSLLEVGCGTGRFLEQLRKRYRVEGLELSGDMLAIACRRLPGVKLHRGDMRDFDLRRRYDIVCCLFGSIAYVRTVDKLRKAIAAMARHVADGGVLVIEPFFSADAYWVDRVTMNTVDEKDLKVSWIYRSARVGRQARVRYHFTVARPDGVEHFTELHTLGLFDEQDYARAFRAAGLAWTHDPKGPAGRGLYIARAE